MSKKALLIGHSCRRQLCRGTRPNHQQRRGHTQDEDEPSRGLTERCRTKGK